MRNLISFLISLLIFTPILVNAQVRTEKAQRIDQQEKLLLPFYKEHGRTWNIHWSKEGDRIEKLMGQSTRRYELIPDSAAIDFLKKYSNIFGLEADLSDLKVFLSKKSPGGSHIEYQQYYQNIPIENAFVKINFDKQGRVLQVISSYVPSIDKAVEIKISQENAVEKAIEHFLKITPEFPRRGVQEEIKQIPKEEMELKEEPIVEQVIFLKDRQAVLVFKVKIKATKPFGIKEFIVEGQTGEIIRIKDFVQYRVNGDGRVFIPNPICALNDNTLVDNGDAADAVPDEAYTAVTLFDLDDPIDGEYRLSGLYVRSEDIESPNIDPVTETSPNFNYDRSQDGFEEVMVYYHIDRCQRYIQTLGFIDVNNRQIRVDAHGMSGVDNAKHVADPMGSGWLAFGDGGSDNGEDADWILHEYGHSIQDNQTIGKYIAGGQTGAMAEGFCDYWACGNFFAVSTVSGWDPGCWGEWREINHSGDNCTRNVINNNIFPNDYNGISVHQDGLIWSGTLWDIFNAIGKTTTDRLTLQSHFNVPDNPSFKDGADAIMTADLQLYYGSHLNTLCQIFMDRGIYDDADCPEIPPLTGDQNTLVVLLRFDESDLPESPIDYDDVRDIINNLNAYLEEVTYDQVALVPEIIGWHDLPHDRAYYYAETMNNMLIELAQDGIDAILSADGDFNFAEYDRMIIITNDDGSGGESRGQQEWTTTGPWPYDLPEPLGTKRLSVSVHTFEHTDAQFSHTIGHHFGLINLYPHEGVTFPRDYANGWGNMARTLDRTSYINCHYYGWSKLRPEWLDNDDVLFIPRPPADPDIDHEFTDDIPIYLQESDTDEREIIQIGTTPDITDRSEETASYYIEARSRSGPYDSNIPDDGVLIYYVNENIAQGFGPLRIVDATPGDNDLSNAAFHIGDGITNIDGTGLSVEVLAPTGTEDYLIHVEYDPPEDEVDVWINSRDSHWRSDDIWVDSPGCNSGNCRFDAEEGRTVEDRGDKPIPGRTNRLYARIYNDGPGIARHVRVDFWISDPYHGIDGGGRDPDTGGNVAFNKHYFTVIENLAPTNEGVPVYVEWEPEPVSSDQGHPHACVKVKITDVFNDTDNNNQVSQENIHEYDTSGSSPYAEVVNPFIVANPYDNPILVYLRADNVPVGWETEIIPEKTYLPVGGSVNAQITIRPPEDYPVCTTEYITVSAWYPSGNTLVQLGGTTAQVNLKSRVTLDVNTELGPCNRDIISNKALSKIDPCRSINTTGCTDPPRPHEHITVVYTGPGGEPIYHDVVTDEHGCFEDFLVNPGSGFWDIDVEYQGDECHHATDIPSYTVIVPPRIPQPSTKFWYSFHLGLGFPIGSFADYYDPGPGLKLDFGYPFSDNLSFFSLFGFHYFHGKERNDLYWYSISGNIKWFFPLMGWRGYLNGGAGYYFPNTGSNSYGINIGTGFNFSLDPRFSFDISGEYYLIDPGGDRDNFINLSMGINFRF